MKPVQSDSNPNWKTPAHIIEEFTEEFGPLYDPCPPLPRSCGLSEHWPAGRAAFVNPPYSRGEIAKWVSKCFAEWHFGGQTIILLIPPYTDTIYFHSFIYPYCELRFIKGRLCFDDGGKPAPFPSMVCIWPGRQESEVVGQYLEPTLEEWI